MKKPLIEIIIAQLKKNKIKKPQIRPADISGSPDLVFRKSKIAIWINSCFWYGCKEYPTELVDDFWSHQRLRKQEQRREYIKDLKAMGWRVEEIWEHEVGKGKTERRLIKLFEEKQ